MPHKLFIAAAGLVGAGIFTWIRLRFPRFAVAAVVFTIVVVVALFAWSYEPSAWVRLTVAATSELYAALSAPLMFVLAAVAGSAIARFFFRRRHPLA